MTTDRDPKVTSGGSPRAVQDAVVVLKKALGLLVFKKLASGARRSCTVSFRTERYGLLDFFKPEPRAAQEKLLNFFS